MPIMTSPFSTAVWTACGQHNGPAPVPGYSGRPVQATSSEPAPVFLPTADWPQSRIPAADHPSLGLQWWTRPSCALQRWSSPSPGFQWQTSPGPCLKQQTSPGPGLQWRTSPGLQWRASPSCRVGHLFGFIHPQRPVQVIVDFSTMSSGHH